MSELIETLKPVEPKRPGESKLYTMDWTAALSDGATIGSSSWSITPTGLTQAAAAIVTGNLKTSIRVSGGVDGTDYEVTNTVTTSNSETLERTGIIRVRRT